MAEEWKNILKDFLSCVFLTQMQEEENCIGQHEESGYIETE